MVLFLGGIAFFVVFGFIVKTFYEVAKNGPQQEASNQPNTNNVMHTPESSNSVGPKKADGDNKLRYKIKNFAPIGEGKQKVALEVMSTLWSKQKEAKVSLEELSQMWKIQNQEGSSTKPVATNIFKNMEIIRFYRDFVDDKQYFSQKARDFVIEVLRIIDNEGDCPSVVNGNNEVESGLETDTYSKLASITLRDHTLHVAKKITGLLANSPALIPKGIISALSHDLGKIPNFRNQLYSIGDHPIIGIAVLSKLPGWSDLPYQNDIIDAVKEHHRNPKAILSTKLLQADQAVRRDELADVMNIVFNTPTTEEESHAAQNRANPSLIRPIEQNLIPAALVNAGNPLILSTSQSLPVKETITEIVEPVRKLDVSIQEEKAINTVFGFDRDSEGNADTPEKLEPINEIEIEWFSSSEYLAVLKPIINVMKGSKWFAWSMPDGLVYFRLDIMWEKLKELAAKHNDTTFMTSSSNETYKRGVLLYVVNRLDRESQAINRSRVSDGYYTSNLKVVMDDDHVYNGFYCVFNAEAFCSAVSTLEAIKYGKVKKIKRVDPFTS